MDEYMAQAINKKEGGLTHGVSVDGTAACDAAEKTAVLMHLMSKGLGGEHALPFQIQWDHIKSTSFVHIRCIMDSTALAPEMRPYLELFLEAVYELPQALADGTVRTHEEVVSQLEADTVTFSNSVGTSNNGNFVCGAFSQCVIMSVKVEESKYDLGVRWLANLLYSSVLDPERLKISATKLLSEVPQHRREGMGVCGSLVKELVFGGEGNSNDNNHGACNFIRQQHFLSTTIRRLNGSVEEKAKVLAEMEAFRAALTAVGGLRLQMTCNATSLADPVRPWAEIFAPTCTAGAGAGATSGPPPALSFCSTHLSEMVKAPSGQGVLLGMPAIESCYMQQLCTGPSSFSDKDYPALMVAINYLTGLEGDFWRKIRGVGLAYSYHISCRPEQGLLGFTLYKANDLPAAFKQAEAIVSGYATGETPLDQQVLDGAKSSTVFDIMECEETAVAAAHESLMNHLKRMGPDHNAELVAGINAVTLEQIKDAICTHLVKLFDVKTSVMVATTPENKAAGIIEKFKAMGRDMQQVETLEAYFGVPAAAAKEVAEGGAGSE
jgi:Zn-dependent M16 (insulinase) family peptidase